MVAPAYIGAEHIIVRKPSLEQVCLNAYNVQKEGAGGLAGNKGWGQASI